MIILVDYVPMQRNYFFYDTFSDFYYNFLKSQKISVKRFFFRLDSNDVDREINRIFTEISPCFEDSEKNYLFLANDWLIDKIKIKINNVLSSVSIISMQYSIFSDFSLFNESCFDKLNFDLLLNILGHSKLGFNNFQEELNFLFDKKNFDFSFDNLKCSSDYQNLKKMSVSFGSCLANFSLNEKNFKNVELPNTLLKWKGCSFCTSKYQSDQGRNDLELELIKKQISFISKSKFAIQNLILNDRVFNYYFEDIMNFLQEKKFINFSLYVQSRVDFFNNKYDQVLKIISNLKNSNLKIYFYLIGFENFSQRILDILNKNIIVEEIFLVIERLNFLEKRFPDFFFSKLGSHGFIMYTPWTQWEDLEKNLHYIKKYDFHKFCSDCNYNTLRLTPDIPLFYKAKQEGLFKERFKINSGSVKRGYCVDYSWSFKDKKVENFYLKNLKK